MVPFRSRGGVDLFWDFETQRSSVKLPLSSGSPARRIVVRCRGLLLKDYRAKGKAQRSRASSTHLRQVASDYVYRALEPEAALFPWSPASFRRRWDKVLQALCVPSALKLTPGGLRGGGAIHAFRERERFTGLLWHMRLKHLATLASYVQEVAALSVVPQLSSASRAKVLAASVLFPFVLQSCTS